MSKKGKILTEGNCYSGHYHCSAHLDLKAQYKSSSWGIDYYFIEPGSLDRYKVVVKYSSGKSKYLYVYPRSGAHGSYGY